MLGQKLPYNIRMGRLLDLLWLSFVIYCVDNFIGSSTIALETFAEFDRVEAHTLIPCRRPGDRYVHNYIQYECFSSTVRVAGQKNVGRGDDDDTISSLDEILILSTQKAPERRDADHTLIARPIGCVPTNATDDSVIMPGATLIGTHFRYECTRTHDSAVSLRITHCVDGNGSLVNIGDFYSATATTMTSVECTGDAFLAKKIVHKWSKCRLKNGGTLVEGNFVVQDLTAAERHTPLQAGEIVSCLRDGARILLKCTGCVTTSGEHVAVTKYLRVDESLTAPSTMAASSQWTQCRRIRDGCRLINVSADYVNCEYEGRKYPHGTSFTSESGLSSFFCSYGVVIKKGCLIDRQLVLVGDVRYINDQPLLCAQSDQIVQFNGIGCDLPSGKFKRFLEVWRDNRVMKRCTWVQPPVSAADATITKSQITAFACIDGKEIVLRNKIVQRPNGEYFKCTSQGVSSDSVHYDDDSSDEDHNVTLEMRTLSIQEVAAYLKRKNSKLDLYEYFGVGAHSAQIELETSPRSRPNGNRGIQCEDMLSFCDRLINYCNSVQGNEEFLESGLAIDREREIEQRFDDLFDASKKQPKTYTSKCEDVPSSFQKLQTLVQISCAKTCRKCAQTNETQKERLIFTLEQSSHCGQ